MGFAQILKTQHAAGTLFNTYTTAKSVINPQATWAIPAGYLAIGDSLRIRVHGGISNVVTAQPTFTFQVMMGTTASPIIVHSSGALTTTTTAHTLIPFYYEALLTLRAEGSGTSANFMGMGVMTGQMFVVSGAAADATSSVATVMGPATAPAVGTGFDSTIANVLDFWCGISASSASTGIQVQQYSVELISERN